MLRILFSFICFLTLPYQHLWADQSCEDLISMKRDWCGDHYCPKHFQNNPDICPLEDIESVKPYLSYIPLVYAPTCAECTRCGKILRPSDDPCGDPDDDTGDACCDCGCTYNVVFEDYTATDEDEELEDCWYQCCDSTNAWSIAYFDKRCHRYFRFFKAFLTYNSENPSCSCIWPERNPIARKINDSVYKTCYQLSSEELLPAEFDAEWKNLNAHGRAAALVTYTFFYSQYHQMLLDACKFIDAEAFVGDKASNAIDLIYRTLDDIQPKFLEIYNQCLAQHPLPKIYYERGMVYFHRGETFNALSDIEKTIEITEENGEDLLNSELYLQEGEAYADLALYDRAIKALTKSIQKDPTNKEAYFQRAAAYFEIERFEDALQDYLDSGFKVTPVNPSFKDKVEFACGLTAGTLNGATDGITDFAPSLWTSFKEINHGLWAFVQAPLDVSQEVVDAALACVQYLKTHSAQETVSQVVPELGTLIQKWDSLNQQQRGEQTGYVLGKYGTDIFLGTSVIKGVKLCRDLKKANMALTLEKFAASTAEQRVVLLEEGVKRAAKREMYQSATQGKILIKHPNARNHVMQKQHDWDKLIQLTGNVETDFNQVVILLEENGIQDVKYLKGKPLLFPIKTPEVSKCNYEMVINGYEVRASFETYLETGETFLQNAWIINKK